MPVSSSTEHWIKPDALTINLNHFGDPDYLQVSLLAGAVVMAFKQDVIGYNAAHNYRTWPLEAANTYLETSSAYNVYARLTRSEVNARALIVYDTVLRDIEGREISYAEDGTEILGDASVDYFFVFLGQISSNIDSNGQIIQREWIVDPNFGNLDTNQQKNDTVGLFDLMFKPHYDNPLDPNEITWIEALTHLGVAGGITMYANGGKLNIPSIYDGLPIDWNTLIRDEDGVLKVNPNIKLGGAPSWDELEGKPDLSVYAKSSDVTAISSKLNDFLEGSDTDNIINKWKELESFLSGLSESDNLATILLTKADKTYVDDTFVTLATSQTITGEKNFTGGLKVNGSPIYYDTSKKYWKLEGDLLVTGGVTMYGSDSSFNPSTIMDAIAVDGTTISKSGGVLKVIGGVGASTMGSLSNVGNWADSVADVDRIMYQAAGSSSWTSKPLSSISASGEYLPLSGGTITGELNVSSTSTNRANINLISSADVPNDLYFGSNGEKHWSITSRNVEEGRYIGLYNNKEGSSGLVFKANFDTRVFDFMNTPTVNGNTLWHSGNDGSGSGLDADTLDGLDSENYFYERGNIVNYADANDYWKNGAFLNATGNGISNSNFPQPYSIFVNFTSGQFEYISQLSLGRGNAYYRTKIDSWSDWREFAFIDSNVASATKLQTARTIWGQSFDGTGNVSGALSNVSEILFKKSGKIDEWGNIHFTTTTGTWAIVSPTFGDIVGVNNNTGNVGIGTTSPQYKLDVKGIASCQYMFFWNKDYSDVMGYIGRGSNSNNNLYIENYTANKIILANNGNQCLVIDSLHNVGIGTTSPSYKLDVNGSSRTSSLTFTNSDTISFDNCGNIKLASRSGTYWHVDTSGGSNVLTAHSNGNVGIGTTNPNAKLHINGSMFIGTAPTDYDSARKVLSLISSGENPCDFILGSNDTQYWSISARNQSEGQTQKGLLFYNYLIGAAMFISTNNYVGIGTTSPTDKLHVTGNLRLKDDSNYGRTIYFGDGEYCYLRESSDDQLTIHANQGLIIADKTTINSNLLVSGGITMYSMRVLKNVVNERGLSLSELSTIKPIRYTWKDGRDNRLHFGGIADDIQQVLPEVVYSTSEGILTMDYGNAAFAIASSLIQPVVDHEKRIAMLEKENKQLRLEVERLKSA